MKQVHIRILKGRIREQKVRRAKKPNPQGEEEALELHVQCPGQAVEQCDSQRVADLLTFRDSFPLCSAGWPCTHCVTQAVFELVDTLLPQLPKSSGYRCVRPHPGNFRFILNPKSSS